MHPLEFRQICDTTILAQKLPHDAKLLYFRVRYIIDQKEGNPGYWSVPVAPGQDGKLWILQGMKGQIMLMTVPPYLARSADEMLLPAEVVKADSVQPG